MNYNDFTTELNTYWNLFNQGLKKQANQFLFEFTERFEQETPERDADDVLYQFCHEYFDTSDIPPAFHPRKNLPYQLTKLLNSYLDRECRKNKMPQMRWARQLFGEYYNPYHDPLPNEPPYRILERAYAHKACDQMTAELYFHEQLDSLWQGQHHFPECSLITQEAFEQILQTAKKILSEKNIPKSLAEELNEYEILYRTYFNWEKTIKTAISAHYAEQMD